MATIAENTTAKAPKTAGERLDRTVRQGKVATAKTVRATKSAGVKAKNFVGKNKAALIAASALGAAGLAGGYAMGKNRGKSED